MIDSFCIFFFTVAILYTMILATRLEKKSKIGKSVGLNRKRQ